MSLWLRAGILEYRARVAFEPTQLFCNVKIEQEHKNEAYSSYLKQDLNGCRWRKPFLRPKYLPIVTSVEY